MTHSDDLFFRNAMTLLLAVFFVFGAVFRARSHSGESLDRRQEGWVVLVSLRLCGLLASVGVGMWLWDPTRFAWARIDLPTAVRWLGLAIGIGAVVWLVWMFRSLGRNLTDTVVTRKDAYLVTNGPYRLVRHPMYAGVLMLSMFLALAAANWLFFTLGASVFAMMCVRLPMEERNLIARFGDGYREYMRTTPRFIPLLG
ncbi:MAG: isoprenylcysteine carboxylmethyltransferase family protein [Acidobacteria bacterium]|nr:isoprenylcysteine carboxylmethyltransferase family protein [Acidobacteriota bacterium]